jgi:biotin synthase-related radical SAM superfamily protein
MSTRGFSVVSFSKGCVRQISEDIECRGSERMPAVDVLLSRVHKQFTEIEHNLQRLEEDPLDSICFASISATLGTLSRSISDLEQVLKRETTFKEQYRT